MPGVQFGSACSSSLCLGQCGSMGMHVGKAVCGVVRVGVVAAPQLAPGEGRGRTGWRRAACARRPGLSKAVRVHGGVRIEHMLDPGWRAQSCSRTGWCSEVVPEGVRAVWLGGACWCGGAST